MKIATIVGARPQFVKAATVSRAVKELREAGTDIEEFLIHTGQHYDHNMSEVFFKEMEIPAPRYNLGIGACKQGAMTGRMMESIEEVLNREHPDWVLVYGDTNSTLAAAIAAVKMHIPVAHVEAGLRSFNRRMPEEINRILADHSSELLFTPTQSATDRLLVEGIPRKKIHQVGDVMYDATMHYRVKSAENSSIVKMLSLSPKKYVLATIHRAENTDDPHRLREIFAGLDEISKEVTVVLPMHPRTRKALEEAGIHLNGQGNLIIIDPVSYLDMIQLESNAQLIMTDSGGVQKEAFFFQVPCLTLRTETEWVELVTHGYNTLVPLERTAIINAWRMQKYEGINWARPLYGKGNAAHAILDTLLGKKENKPNTESTEEANLLKAHL